MKYGAGSTKLHAQVLEGKNLLHNTTVAGKINKAKVMSERPSQIW